MKFQFVRAVGVCLLVWLMMPANASALPGVAGELVLIEKDQANANTPSKVQVKVGDKIEITWSYPVVPGSIPMNVGATSDTPATVKVLEIRQVVKPGIVGAGTLGAFYSAEAVGKTKIYFNINNGGTGARLECEVEVVP